MNQPDRMGGSVQRTKRSTRTRNAIINAASEVLAERGYELTSMDDIAERAGITKATVYYHFNRKEDIYWETLVSYITKSCEKFEQHIRIAASPAVAFAAIFNETLSEVMDPATKYIFYQEMVQVSPVTRAAIAGSAERYATLIESLIERGQEVGEIIEGDSKLIYNIVMGSAGRTARWYNPEGPVKANEFRQLMYMLVFSGVLTPNGRKQIERADIAGDGAMGLSKRQTVKAARSRKAAS